MRAWDGSNSPIVGNGTRISTLLQFLPGSFGTASVASIPALIAAPSVRLIQPIYCPPGLTQPPYPPPDPFIVQSAGLASTIAELV